MMSTMDATITVDHEGYIHLSLLTEEAREWFNHYYHASFAVAELVKDPRPFVFTGDDPDSLCETMEFGGLTVSMNRIHYW